MNGVFDVIIVGARCAGSPLAAMLAGGGLRVCLVDKAGFPSDTASAHAIQAAGVQVLERLGVLGALLEVAPPLRRGRMVFDDGFAEMEDFVEVSHAPVLNVRRTVLDKILVDRAAEAGADVRTGTTVTGLVMDGDRVGGIQTTAGAIRAPLVIGADGTGSTVARLVGAEEYHPTVCGRLFMWAYYAADPTGGEMWMGKRGDHTYLVMPTDGGLSLVGACPSIDRRAAVRGDRDAAYEAGLRGWPELHERMAGAQREGPVRTMANMRGYFRPSAGPGWALVGDAGHFKDPTPGLGIADALRQAEKLAATIQDAFGDGPQALDDALLEWWRWRDEDAWEMYWYAYDLGASGPAPLLVREVQRRIVAEPALTTEVSRIFNHDRLPSEVFTPAFSLATAARALRRGRGQRRQVLREMRTVMRDDAQRRRAARMLTYELASLA
jgi:2-polyprenyl-6-methoxyphenol hydroxylase-like FAD-dependent oxidoreductase